MGDQEKPGSSPGFLVAGPTLWWRGLKLAWRTRWPFWAPVGLAVYGFVGPLSGLAYTPLYSELGLSALPSDLSAPWAVDAIDAALRWARFDTAFCFKGLPCLLLMALFAVALWHFFLKGERAQNNRLAALVGLISGVLIAGLIFNATLSAWAPSTRELMQGTGKLNDPQHAVRTLAALGRVWTLDDVLSVVFVPVSLGWLGTLFREGAGGREPRPWAALTGLRTCFWLLLLYSLARSASGLWDTAYRAVWRKQFLAEAATYFVVAKDVSWLIILLVVAAFPLLALDLMVKTLAFPFPFLVLSGNGSFREALKTMLSLWRERWKPLASLWLLTVLPMAALGVAGAMEARSSNDLAAVLAVRQATALLALLLSIGGCMGMFLLIEGWRAGIRSDLAEGSTFTQAGPAGRAPARPDEAGRGMDCGRV